MMRSAIILHFSSSIFVIDNVSSAPLSLRQPTKIDRAHFLFGKNI